MPPGCPSTGGWALRPFGPIPSAGYGMETDAVPSAGDERSPPFAPSIVPEGCVESRRPRAIIVEDDPDILLILRNTLEDAGFETSLAADGSTAMRRIETERPHVVLLDLMLPLMDGWSVLAELRDRPDAPKVVVCTARVSQVERDRALEMGAAEYVTKPFDVDELVELVWDVVRREPAGGAEPASPEPASPEPPEGGPGSMA